MIEINSPHKCLNPSEGKEEGILTDILVFPYLRTLMETFNGSVFCLDNHYKYICFNVVHIRVMKEFYNADIEIGHNIFEYQYIDEDKGKAKHNIDRSLAGEVVMSRDYSGDPILKRRYIEVFHYPVHDLHCNIIGVVVIAKNHNDVKK